MSAAPAVDRRTTNPALPRGSRAWDALVVLILLCATLVMTYPLPAQLGTHLAGDDYDVWNRPWVTWWTKTALQEGHRLYWTDMLFHPRGVSLVYHSFSHVNSAIALVLEPLTGWIAAHNVTILLAYFLSGVGAYLLAQDLTGRRDAALIAGLVFAFSTYHVDQSAHVILVTTQWIPLWILAVVRLFRGRRPVRRALEAALFLTLTALSSWHLLLFSAIWLAFYVVYLLIWGRDQVDWPRLRALALMGLATALLVGPLLFPLLSGLLTGGAGGDVTVPYQGENAIDVLAFFVPSRRHPVFGPLVEALHGRIGRRQVFLGYVPLALAVVGAVTAGRKARFWVLSTLAFFAMSLGAYIRFNGTLSDRPWQPWLIPLIEFIRDPTRLTVMTTLGLAVLAALGAAWLLRRLRRPAAVGIAAALSALILFELLPWPFPTVPIELPAFYEEIRESPETFALADLPVRHLEARRQVMFYQIVHQKPIIEGIVARTPPEAYAFIEGHPILSAFADDAGPPGLDLSRQLGALAAADVRFLVLHRRFMTAEQIGRWQNYLPYQAYAQDDTVLVYRTEPVVGQDLPVAFPVSDGVGLAQIRLSDRYPRPGDSLALRAAWVATRDLAGAYRVGWTLLDRQGAEVGSVEGPLCPDWPVEAWSAGDFAWGEYTLPAPGRAARSRGAGGGAGRGRSPRRPGRWAAAGRSRCGAPGHLRRPDRAAGARRHLRGGDAPPPVRLGRAPAPRRRLQGLRTPLRRGRRPGGPGGHDAAGLDRPHVGLATGPGGERSGEPRYVRAARRHLHPLHRHLRPGHPRPAAGPPARRHCAG